MKVITLLLALAFVPGAADKGKPTISVKASPAVAFSPARVKVTADINGGPNDYEDFYCASVEWVWGDGTLSNESSDCEPVRGGQERDQATLHRRPGVQSIR